MARYILHSHWYLDRSSKERVKSFIPHTHTHTHTHTHQLISFYAFIYIYVMSVMSALFVFDKRLFYPNERHYTPLHPKFEIVAIHSNSMLHSNIHLNWIGTAPWRVKWSEAISNFEMDLQFCLVCYRTAPIIYLCYSFGTNERMESRGRGLTSSRFYSTVHWNRDQDGNPIQSNPIHGYIYTYTYIAIYLFYLTLTLTLTMTTNPLFVFVLFVFFYILHDFNLYFNKVVVFMILCLHGMPWDGMVLLLNICPFIQFQSLHKDIPFHSTLYCICESFHEKRHFLKMGQGWTIFIERSS